MQEKWLLVLLMAFVLITSPTVYASEGVVIKVPKIHLTSPNDFVIVRYWSEGSVVVSYSKVESVGAFIESINDKYGSRGEVEIHLKNATNKAVLYTLIFSSNKPIELNVSIVKEGVASLIASYIVPGNISAQLELSMLRTLEVKPLSFGLLDIISPSLPTWEYVIYSTLFPLFLITGYLDVKDYKRKFKRWSKMDTFSLLLRYAFYASSLILVFILIGSFISIVLARLLGMMPLITLTDLMLASILFLILTVIYAIGKWRGWYELIDEQ